MPSSDPLSCWPVPHLPLWPHPCNTLEPLHHGPLRSAPRSLCPRPWRGSSLDTWTTRDAQEIANKYGKSLRLIMITAGLTTKATWAELIWNMHQAWYAGTHSKQSGVAETTKDYHAHQMQHYEEHKDEHDYPQLWVDIDKFWKECVTGAKDMSLKAMVGQVMTCRDAFTQASSLISCY
ncbi:hypothetical protein EDC04DRAFT_2602762 [Pisolithus marmoratus]|nr:hypothetical protein EDC04DRAFT_2602762 [Pisolithus marmoratus]